ncbi:sigma 54-interacting transcriptional regulator [Clostridium botulinum]|uniref:ATPase AAA n=1 Tax=Clostridium botulinum C/D str. DC5 TaxID=1443128 RepID=A0A0A0ILA6_CLOBO|nr:sigma 54-interacting transcriptional regulator [Clostridium botulinum]KGM96305.1 ATPase AAA [Clostridium botulinum D str. CCUG 7971]KGN01037.1 ATPase AAA [Clostridium botulinum C/D str. DC5]KOC49459.1 AAA family ATPase [Clostridium botulinum]KOC53331.1 AAA family ATPase [Clostridium botulinum]KOC56559.1 AAA family ATPase [Clostridium botulinum]
MNNFDLLVSNIILTDKKGTIMDCNDFAKSLLKKNNIIGMNIHDFDSILKNYKIKLSSFNDKNLYIITENNSKNFFDTIIRNSFDEIFVTDKNGIAIFCNDAFEKHYGIPKNEIIGKHVSYVCDNGYVDKILIDVVMETKKSITYEQKTKVGRTILNTSTPILDENGEIIYIIENCRDITNDKVIKDVLPKIKISNAKQENNKTLNTKSIEFKSPQMSSIYTTLERFASKNINILILGKSGTGKSSLAKMVHEKSPRKHGPFVTINCSTIPESLIESELFGYTKGSFTGASSKGKLGLVQIANGGTLFLDEIGELPLKMQSKLLELVQEKTYLPIGDVRPKYVDTRIIAATNQNISKLISENKFREDLYYRLAVATINIPPLNQRTDDVYTLINYYLHYFNNKHQCNIKISKEAMNILLHYSWPGNIRELEHMIEFLVINSINSNITLEDLPPNILENCKITRITQEKTYNKFSYKKKLEISQQKIIQEAYSIYNSSYKLAKALQISQTTANRLINKYCK